MELSGFGRNWTSWVLILALTQLEYIESSIINGHHGYSTEKYDDTGVQHGNHWSWMLNPCAKETSHIDWSASYIPRRPLHAYESTDNSKYAIQKLLIGFSPKQSDLYPAYNQISASYYPGHIHHSDQYYPSQSHSLYKYSPSLYALDYKHPYTHNHYVTMTHPYTQHHTFPTFAYSYPQHTVENHASGSPIHFPSTSHSSSHDHIIPKVTHFDTVYKDEPHVPTKPVHTEITLSTPHEAPHVVHSKPDSARTYSVTEEETHDVGTATDHLISEDEEIERDAGSIEDHEVTVEDEVHEEPISECHEDEKDTNESHTIHEANHHQYRPHVHHLQHYQPMHHGVKQGSPMEPRVHHGHYGGFAYPEDPYCDCSFQEMHHMKH